MYKIYKSGQDFLNGNNDILAKYPLETVFFGLNASVIKDTNTNDFIIKTEHDGKYLIAVHCSHFPMVIFGDNGLCAEFAKAAYDLKLTFDKVLGAMDTCEAFLTEYEKFTNCTHAINHAMDIMRCNKPNLCDVDGVEPATENDLNEVAIIAASFEREALSEDRSVDYYKQSLQGRMHEFCVIRHDGKIVSMAAKSRETDKLCAISWVYTSPQYRNLGLSCKIVTYLTKNITDTGRLAYLFVDKTNPISNYLYSKIGYTYATPQYEYILKR